MRLLMRIAEVVPGKLDSVHDDSCDMYAFSSTDGAITVRLMKYASSPRGLELMVASPGVLAENAWYGITNGGQTGYQPNTIRYSTTDRQTDELKSLLAREAHRSGNPSFSELGRHFVAELKGDEAEPTTSAKAKQDFRISAVPL